MGPCHHGKTNVNHSPNLLQIPPPASPIPSTTARKSSDKQSYSCQTFTVLPCILDRSKRTMDPTAPQTPFVAYGSPPHVRNLLSSYTQIASITDISQITSIRPFATLKPLATNKKTNAPSILHTNAQCTIALTSADWDFFTIYDERVPWIHRSPTITATIPLSCTTSHTTLHRASNPHHIQTSIRSNHTLITLVLIFKLTRFLSNVRPKLLCKKQDIVKCRNRFNTLPPPYSLPTALIPMPIYHCSPTRTRFHPTPPWVGICPRPTDTRCR